MSLQSVLGRIDQIHTMLYPNTASSGVAPGAAASTTVIGSAAPAATAPAGQTFMSTLQSAMAPSAMSPSAAADIGAAGSGGNPAMVAIAASQVGQTEQPPGSNDSPAIAAYRTATAGATAGAPWCAYFASWVARQAGEPIGSQGQGLGYVGDIWNWAQQTGRAIPNGPGVTPQPGDLIVFGDHHVGIVDQVLQNGDIETIEGNYDNKVSQVVRGPNEAAGYVAM
jgi:hypothetical protein